MTPGAILNQVNRLTRHLVATGLADDQQQSYQRVFKGRRDSIEVTFENAELITSALKGTPYVEVYEDFVRNRAFNVKLLDGALVQMTYAFSHRSLERHRLAFLSAPHLQRFDRDPESYVEDQMYADILSRDVLPLTIRLDYDSRDERHRDIAHPKSHLTLGEYDHCRIPVSAPLTPHRFIDFVLRNFYRTRSGELASDLPRCRGSFGDTITRAEREVMHVIVPA